MKRALPHLPSQVTSGGPSLEPVLPHSSVLSTPPRHVPAHMCTCKVGVSAAYFQMTPCAFLHLSAPTCPSSWKPLQVMAVTPNSVLAQSTLYPTSTPHLPGSPPWELTASAAPPRAVHVAVPTYQSDRRGLLSTLMGAARLIPKEAKTLHNLPATVTTVFLHLPPATNDTALSRALPPACGVKRPGF